MTGDNYPASYGFFLTAARTGMRLGEILGLRWLDADFQANVLWVRRSYRRGVFGPPKNGKVRKVQMSDQLRDHLWALIAENFKDVDELVFNRKDGQPIEQNYIRRVHARNLKKAGLKHLKLHGLRHSYASIL